MRSSLNSSISRQLRSTHNVIFFAITRREHCSMLGLIIRALRFDFVNFLQYQIAICAFSDSVQLNIVVTWNPVDLLYCTPPACAMKSSSNLPSCCFPLHGNTYHMDRLMTRYNSLIYTFSYDTDVTVWTGHTLHFNV